MPNWECDEDYFICEHCHARHDVDEWHTCQEGYEASQRKNEAFERRYKGSRRIRGQLTIVFECYDSDMAIQSVVENAVTEMLHGIERTNAGADAVLNFRWVGQLEKVKIK